MALWIPCALLSAFEAGLSVWCFIVGLALRGLAPCGKRLIKEEVCVCVLVFFCVEAGVYLNLRLSQQCTQTHTSGLTQTHIQFIHTYLHPLGLSLKVKITTPFTFAFPPFSLVVGGGC